VRASRFTLSSGAPDEVRTLAAAVRSLASSPANVTATVHDILAAVRERGDSAVVELTRRFDSESAPSEVKVAADDLARALDGLDPAVRTALEAAIVNVREVAELELQADRGVELAQGQRVELKEIPVGRAGSYVPGGRAAYPSTVMMCAVPARVAGVGRVAVATPPGPSGEASPLVLAACALCEVDEVYRMGGAQAIGALAYGTESVEPVDVIVGPGNHYVQEAKRQVSGFVGIDGIAGPSELVVVADEQLDPALAALDLAAQAEHGDDSLVVLLSPDSYLLDEVDAAVKALEDRFDTISGAPLALVAVPDLDAGIGLANAIAPEHLELGCADADTLADKVTSAGCVFVGVGAGTAFGDYAVGSNHVLPTGGAARFAGPLGPGRFRRRQALVSLPETSVRALAPFVSSLARAEGFPVHAESATQRADSSARETQ
jgi:histidinol dehydrogenase